MTLKDLWSGIKTYWIWPAVGLVVLVAFVVGMRMGRNPSVPTPPTPDITLPTEVDLAVSEPGLVTAKTAGTKVLWHTHEKELHVKTFDAMSAWVWSSTPGKYELSAYTAVRGVPTEMVKCLVVVSPRPPPGPGPNPPIPPTPEPSDPFFPALKAAWQTETALNKDTDRQQLAGLYQVAAETTVADPSLKTCGELLAKLHAAAESLLPMPRLKATREAIAAELKTKLPTSPSAPLDDMTRQVCRGQYSRMAGLLDTLGRK